MLIYGKGGNMEKGILSIILGVNPVKSFSNDFIKYLNLDDAKYNYNNVKNIIDSYGNPLLKCLNFIE